MMIGKKIYIKDIKKQNSTLFRRFVIKLKELFTYKNINNLVCNLKTNFEALNVNLITQVCLKII